MSRSRHRKNGGIVDSILGNGAAPKSNFGKAMADSDLINFSDNEDKIARYNVQPG
jgi:hypothetical protein